ncbi:MAG TPA: hypothetical protein VFR90_08660 [Methylibium sp.]|uniref:hypothetical protein n=1 Tax=Methylibium sp. TaxID=2067992 RepID=UPI002DB89BB0|nr:hypothetical protein [Methylibium sp.]HEU4459177.1 hypothetical protein [Methylibium sp.]
MSYRAGQCAGALGTAASRGAAVLVLAAVLAACGGGGDNPLGNPPTVANPEGGANGQKLSFVYYQRCINPLFVQPIVTNGAANTCAASGCHGDATGVGGAFRLVPAAALVDLANAGNTPEVVRQTDMYKNFYSAQGSSLLGDPAQSLLLKKPLVQNVLHGGGVIFLNEQDPNVRRIRYWIGRPVPQGQDEFSTAAGNAMFTPPDAATGTCNSQ